MIGEAPYFLDRLDHLSRGLIPYRQFEFAYGPLLLYPEVWVARLLHVGYATGYSIVWVASWLIGIWMVWELVRSVDIASRRRTHIFTLICVLIAPAIASRGLNYTALRIFCAAFVVLMVHRVCWRWRRPLWTLARLFWVSCLRCIIRRSRVWALPLDLLSISPILPRASATRFRGARWR